MPREDDTQFKVVDSVEDLLHWEQDAEDVESILPCLALQEIAEEIRRSKKRFKAPSVLYAISQSGSLRPVDLLVLVRNVEPEWFRATLIDFTAEGLSIALDCELQVGEQITLEVVSHKNDEKIFQETFNILNVRPMPKRNGVKMAGYRVGLRSSGLDKSAFKKVILDSVYIAHLQELKGVPVLPER